MSEDRNSKFLNAIERYAKEQQKALKAKFRDIRKNELGIAEAEALRDAYYLIQEEMVKMHKAIDGKISRSELNNKRLLIKKRKEIKDEVFKRAKESLLKVAEDEEKYLEILKNSVKKIAEILNYSGTVFYVKKEDIKYSDYIKEVYGRSAIVKAKDSILIGGIIGENYKLSIVVNETLDEKLKLQEVWFMQNSGLKIT